MHARFDSRTSSSPLDSIVARVVRTLAALTFLAGAARADDEPAEHRFVRRIQPLLAEKCLGCHGRSPTELAGGLDLRSAEAARRGGESGRPALVPGKPLESPLYLAATRRHDDWSPMPPKEADRLSPEQLEAIRAWIAADAPWPDEKRSREIAREHAARWEAAEGTTVATSGGLSNDWTRRRYKPEALWAYRPVRKPSPPGAAGNPIDAFLAARAPEGLTPAPAADARTFLRRITFDLLGLPPTPEETARFAEQYAQDADAAVLALVDRLLNSPHYGERMAQHWLDVVRYADSSGFANDYERGSAWRYRDYVVRSFNADKPYDQFVREQLAGDEFAPHDPEMLVATGFLRMGPWELTGMEVAKVARQRFLDDVTNGVGETFLAHSLQCARCHDHKFDPIPTRDYYAVQAVFATTQLAERPAAFLATENTSGFEERRFLELRRDEHLATLRELDDVLLRNAEAWFAERRIERAEWDAAVAGARAAAESTRASERSGRFVGVFEAARGRLQNRRPEDSFPPKFVGFTPEQFGRERVARKGLERLAWEFDRYEPIALAVYSGRTPQRTSVNSPQRPPARPLEQGELERTSVLTGGDPFAPGEPVKPGVLSVLGDVQRTPIPESIEGRRRAFADWAASPDNPLVTRAIVNRVWMWRFGRPLAGNPNNFGATGGRPTHPDLLDWLAATLVERGWSLKGLQREILTSAAYRRSGVPSDRAALRDLDPLGTNYAAFAPRRLTAEELRDAMLCVTGELVRTSGGIPNRPEINLEAALQPRQVMGTFAAAWTPDPLPRRRHRRSLYALKLRGLVDPMLEVFNAPAPDFSCERRETSTVAPQAFSLFNGRAAHAQALALAARVVRETSGDEAAVERAFQLVYARRPDAEELRDCLTHWRETLPLAQEAPVSEPPPRVVRREAIEENTGERFAFDEKLLPYADFTPDLQPADVDARTRALADLCLVLLNSNEFAYVD